MRFLLRQIIFFGTYLLCSIALADTITESKNDTIMIGLHLASIHSATGYNDLNPGAYIELSNHITIGHYYNSNYKESTYTGYTYGYTDNIDLTMGLVTGYQIYKYTPLFVPSYKFPNLVNSFTLRLAFIPRFFGVVQANVLHAMVETSF